MKDAPLKILKVLIIKTGFSETFTPEIERTVSLGDVLRSTALLHLYQGCRVTWLTSEAAMPLLERNKGIAELLPYDLTSVLQLEKEEFDIVINLEKVPGICALTDEIKAWQRYGFRFNSVTGKAEAYVHAIEGLYVANDEERKRTNKKHWLALLYDMVGKEWRGESYSLGYKPKTTVKYDIGLNYKVGQKFAGKEWAIEKWIELEKELVAGGYTVAWQPSPSNVRDYIDWIQECRTIISNDSLGLHVAIALGKKVVGLFGPTPAMEIQPYESGKMIQRAKMNDIKVSDVEEAVCIVEKS